MNEPRLEVRSVVLEDTVGRTIATGRIRVERGRPEPAVLVWGERTFRNLGIIGHESDRPATVYRYCGHAVLIDIDGE